MKTEVCTELYTKDLLRSNPNKIYVYGDNLKRFGKGGQAIIRDEPNAFGIPTKRYPSRDDWAYFSDKPDEIEALMASLRELYTLGQSQTIVFPYGGIGTGLAQMASRSPKAVARMNSVLKEFFFFENRC